MKFTLVNPPADPVLAGAKITEHWLQLLNEDQPYNHFGFAIARRQGFWELDNGDKAPGDGPFYDSNGGNIVPPTFLDTPGPIEGIGGVSGIGAYLHFTTIPSWDVLVGATNYAIVGDTGITWGFTVVPEPSTIILVGVGIVLITIVARFQRTRALSSKKG